MAKDSAGGASASLNTTITEIMTFLKDNGERPNRDFRPFLHEKLADFGEYGYMRGVRGHIQSYKIFKETGEVPSKLRYKAHREFFDGQEGRVSVRSKIKPVAPPAKA